MAYFLSVHNNYAPLISCLCYKHDKYLERVIVFDYDGAGQECTYRRSTCGDGKTLE